MIEIKHLRTLSVLAQTGSLVNSAERLCLTQSALSHQLKDLEGRLNCKLFERKTSPVRFTEQGQLLLELATKVLPMVDTSHQQLKQMHRQHKPLLLSVECHACFHWLLPVINQFQQRHKQTPVQFDTDISYDAVEALLQQEFDVVLTSDVRKEHAVDFTPLFNFEVVLAVAPNHRLATKAHITPDDLSEERLISYPIPRARQDLFKSFLPEAVFNGEHKTVEQGQYLLQLVAANQGIAALPDWLVSNYVKQGLLVTRRLGIGIFRTMYLATRQSDKHKKQIADFITLCQNTSLQPML